MSKIDRVINWIKKYWYLILIFGSGVSIILVSIFFKGKAKALIDAFESNRKNYEKEVDKIEKINSNTEKKKEELINKHQKHDKLVEKKLEMDKKEIEENKLNAEKDLSTKTSSELAERLKDEFKL